MNLKKKKGFTIIELVIVIAVIGILTAVLVPTFINLTAKANEAADQSLVKNLNTALKMEEQTAGHQKAPTLQGAVDDLENQGYLLNQIVSKSGQDLLWDQEKNEFVLDKEDKYSGGNYWQIVDRIPNNPKYSYYASKSFGETASGFPYGFDAGENTNIKTINYLNEGAGKNVAIRTNNALTTLNIKAPLDDVYHYGNANVVNVTNVKKTSYHENGAVATINVKEGKVEVEKDAFVGKIAVDKDATSSIVEVVTTGTVFGTDIIAYDPTNYNHGSLTETEKEAAASYDLVEDVETIDISTDAIQIDNADALINIANMQSQGLVTGALTIELIADIDLQGRSWVPFGADIGTYGSGSNAKPFSNAFEGVFDGKNHTIKGLSNGTYKGIQTQNSSTPFVGENYGFIVNVKNTIEIKDLTFSDVNIDAKDAKICGIAVAVTQGSNTEFNPTFGSKVTLNNVDVVGNSSIVAKDKVGGLIGYATAPSGNTTNIELIDCDVNAKVSIDSEDGYRIGGLIGQMGDRSSVTVKGGSSFSGSVSIINGGSNPASGAIVGFKSRSSDLYVSDFSATGEIIEPVNTKGNKVVDTNGLALLWAQKVNTDAGPMITKQVSGAWKILGGDDPETWTN